MGIIFLKFILVREGGLVKEVWESVVMQEIWSEICHMVVII